MRCPFPLLLLVAALTACGTPQEQCIRTNTRDLRTLDRLIAETEANIARGYAYEEYSYTHTVWVPCRDRATGQFDMCPDEQTDTVRKPVAIDLGAERAKLAGMKKKRAELAERAAAVVAACKQKFPE